MTTEDNTEDNTDDAVGADTTINRGRDRRFRWVAHRPAGDPPRLPFEGRLGSFSGATAWLNSDPLTPQALRGRVVLVDFWTFTCVNWLRTLPYVRAWATKYADLGLSVVGVHTPEFSFESDIRNVAAQIQKLGIDYPVAVDDNYDVWHEFANHYWPAIYLADTRGRIRYHHFGEGEYATTEMAIQQLLYDVGAGSVHSELVVAEPHGLEVAADWQTLRSPETYLGYRQSSGFASEHRASPDRPHMYAGTPSALNSWDLTGDWTFGPEAVRLNQPGGRISMRFHARDLNLVMAPGRSAQPIQFKVRLDGLEIATAHGTDVDDRGQGILAEQNTYQLIRQTGPITDRLFEIEFFEAGASAFCITFG
ncbi:redoxin family protein [Agromyces humatus]|uniref:Thioredoxin domain-containing protein n=1 Tax=Agromyces humatus TaxID=279573 RepID=A0ABN2KMK3_9MICO|nr:redoxin family protein [Agromyces humatus]